MKKVTLALISQKVKKLATAEGKVTTAKKELAEVVALLAVKGYDKNQVRNKLTEEFEANGFSQKYIKKVRGYIMGIFETITKNPESYNNFMEKLQKVESDNQLEKLSRDFKKSNGTFELNIKKETKENTKSEFEEALEIIKKYIKLPKSFQPTEEKINLLLEEVEKIEKLLTE